MLEKLILAVQATSHLEMVSVAFGLAYVILAAWENSWCWPCAFIGTGTAVVLFWEGLLPMESALNAYYLLMAIYGWWQWQGLSNRNGENLSQNQNKNGATLKISSWQTKQHLVCLVTIAILCLISGYYLSRYTNAALPYLDSFTTWSAVIATWMVTRKILENWLYWVVINAASIYLYLDREFYLYAALFVIYIVIAGYGYYQWRKQFLRSSINA